MRARTVGLITAAALAAGGCAGASSAGNSSAGGGANAAPAAVQSSKALGATSSSGSATMSQSTRSGSAQDANVTVTKLELPKQRSTIIKTGRLSLRLSGSAIAGAVPAVDAIATRYGGYTLSTESSGTTQRSATIVLRVPAAFFDRAMNDLRRVGHGTVLSDVRSGEDVGQEFVDLGARARNLRAQSRALVRLMDRAVSVQDTIRVQNELFQVQGQLDEIDGRLRYLHDQADMSTITVSLTQQATAHHHHHSPPTALGSAFRRGWDLAVGVVSAMIVAAGVIIPVALLVGVALLIGLRLAPAVRRWLASLRRQAQDAA
ncbi:MAG TPA: DUF4349 domain-containing protein [Gaiellales bacterium]|nr:DUF4349 domain-containing protein [Gaiellales bacterium]